MTPTYEWNNGLVDPADPLRLPGARQAIRDSHLRTSRRLLVIDDDPTGSQAVHGVDVVIRPDLDTMAAALQAPGSTCFVLTNSRSLPESEAVAHSRQLALVASHLEHRFGGRVEVISRSDSTLRGHVLAELTTLAAMRRESMGQGYDGVLLVPSYFEAGRFTAANIHWAHVNGRIVAVGETEFAGDAAFGYSNSDLRLFLEEKSGGAIAAKDVHSLSLQDIRGGGPERVAEILLGVHDGAFVVVNSVDYADLEVVALGLLVAEDAGRCFLYRVAPSFVQVLGGLDPIAPLDASSIWPAGRPQGHGLVVVGSHVGLTNRQIEVLEARRRIERIVVETEPLMDPREAPALIRHCAQAGCDALAAGDVLLMTSRTLRRGANAEESLRMARLVSAGLAAIVRQLLGEHPAWIVAKGGITAHDVLDAALGITRAEVVGQLFPGFVSVLRPLEARAEAIGMPCVVFAGNVGSDSSLADAVAILGGP